MVRSATPLKILQSSDRECTVKERREVAVQSIMSMGKEAQKRDVTREKQIPSENRSIYRGTEDRDRRRDKDRETRNKN